MSNNKASIKCSFCGKASHVVKKLIAGPGDIYICDECTEKCYAILHQRKAEQETEQETELKIPIPSELKEYIDRYIIGQDEAKRLISVGIYNHFMRINHNKSIKEEDAETEIELDKSNIILIGPSGSGKTAIVQTIAKYLDIPLSITDATALTEAGYVGEEIESVVTRLVQSCNYDIKKAQYGIVFIDEIDKKSRKSDSSMLSRDISGEGVQQGLLKLVEGYDVRVPISGKKMMGTETVTINTKNILFIIGGAFDGLSKIIEKRLQGDNNDMGILSKIKDANTNNNILSLTEPEDLVKYGIIPEFVGRFSNIAVLNELTEDQLLKILVEPKNSIIKQYQKIFKMEGVDLNFDNESLELIAKHAKNKKTGARGLRNVIDHRLNRLQFDLPEMSKQGINQITIDASIILGIDDKTKKNVKQ